MSENKFSEATSAAIWLAFNSAPRQVPSLSEIARDTAFSKAVDKLFSWANDPWCCKLSRRHKSVVAKDGTRLKLNFCPGCGKKLYL